MDVEKEIADQPGLIPKGQEMLLSIAKFIEKINMCQTSPTGENFWVLTIYVPRKREDRQVTIITHVPATRTRY